MRRLVAVENMSLDGVMQGPGRPDEDPRGGFTAGGWATEWLSTDPDAAMAAFAGQGTPSAMLFGRRTYDDVVGFWLGTDQPNPFAEILRATPKYVASRSEAQLPYPNSQLLRGDLLESVATLRGSAQSDGDIVLLGSGDVVRQLAAAGLVDEYVLTVIPIVLGSGSRLFQDTPARLEATRTYTSPKGAIVGTYRVLR